MESVLELKMVVLSVCAMSNEFLNLANQEREKEKPKFFIIFFFISLLDNSLSIALVSLAGKQA